MKLLQFQLLSQEEQVNVLYREGVYIGKKKSGRLTCLLYQLGSFYVELAYVNYRKSICKIRVSDSTTILNPYLTQIEVEYLVT